VDLRQPGRAWTKIRRSVRLVDLFAAQIDAMKAGDVIELVIPAEHRHEIELSAWRSAVTAKASSVFPKGGYTTAQTEHGIEVMAYRVHDEVSAR